MKEKLKKFGTSAKSKWLSLGKMLRMILLSALALIVIILIIIAVSGSLKKKDDVGYIVLYKDMSSAETAEVAKILSGNGTPTKMNSKGELMVPETEWDRITVGLAAKGYPKTTPSYGSFFDDLSMTMTDGDKDRRWVAAVEQKLSQNLRLIEGIINADVTLNIAESSDIVWEQEKQKSSASVMLTLDTLSPFTNENVSAVKFLVSSATQKMSPSDVTVVSNSGKLLLSSEEVLGIDPNDGTTSGDDDSKGGVQSGMTLEEQEKQQRRELALESAAAQQAQIAVVNVLEPLFGEGNVAASAAFDLNYDTVIQELIEYLPTDEENGTGVPTDEHVEYTIDKDLKVDDGGIVGEDENTDIPTYQNNEEGDLTNDDATHYKRDTYWAISQIITQKELAKGAVNSASIGVSVIDNKNPVLSESDRQKFCELIANSTNISVDKVSLFAQYKPLTPDKITVTAQSTRERFNKLFVSILPWLVGLVLLIIILIILLVVYGKRKTRREVHRAELESQAAIQSLQTTLDEHKRSLQDEVEAHQAETNSTANEVRDFVKENPEITAALIRSMLKNEG
ncbi:MAG: hypothetical protein LBM93_07795 [Oscillospiraceae bacterium]|jgi:flagellar biosynthesis/type III secretory pathway M-ring protein FliF/YscJ|nr:hypothetical protein [Oscillospiraceae bacterium]